MPTYTAHGRQGSILELVRKTNAKFDHHWKRAQQLKRTQWWNPFAWPRINAHLAAADQLSTFSRELYELDALGPEVIAANEQGDNGYLRESVVHA